MHLQNGKKKMYERIPYYVVLVEGKKTTLNILYEIPFHTHIFALKTFIIKKNELKQEWKCVVVKSCLYKVCLRL